MSDAAVHPADDRASGEEPTDEASPAEPAPFDADVLRNAARKLDLIDIELVGAGFHRPDIDDLPPTKFDETVIPDGFDLRGNAAQIDEPAMLVCLVSVSTTFEADPPPFTIEASFRLTYALRPGESLVDDEIEQFTNHNAPFNAWPYWREFAANIAERADLPRMVVPMFRVPATTRPQPERRTEETGSATATTSE